jgi:uncharacterized protein (TIGR00266 family)
MQNTIQYSYRIVANPDFAMVKIDIPRGHSLQVEASSMVAMDAGISMKTRLKGGMSRFLAGESIFINEFTAQNKDCEISIAPGCPGDVTHVFLNNETIYLQSASFVAAHPDIKIDTKWQGVMKGFFSGESLFLIKCSGTGDLFFNTFGSIVEIDNVDSDLVVDTGHIVAFTEDLNYSVNRLGGYKSLFFSGEGLVCQFRGQGKVWIQTRKPNSFLRWLHLFRPAR